MQLSSTAHCLQCALRVCMKTREELYQKVRLSQRLPRVVLKSNSQCGQEDLRSQDGWSSWDPPGDSESYGETWNNAVDYRIPGILSTVEQQETTRENKVKKLIEKFENHQHKISFLQDLSQTQKINKFSKRIEGSDRRHEQHRDLRTLRTFFQTAMSCAIPTGKSL